MIINQRLWTALLGRQSGQVEIIASLLSHSISIPLQVSFVAGELLSLKLVWQSQCQEDCQEDWTSFFLILQYMK